MMKKIIAIISIVIILFAGYVFYFQQSHVDIEVEGISNVSFQYKMNSRLSCVLNQQENIKNNDTIVFECRDPYLSFLKKEIKFLVSGLDEVIITKDELISSGFIHTTTSHVYVKIDTEGSSLYTISKQENDQYMLCFYPNLFFQKDKIIQRNIENNVVSVNEMEHNTIQNVLEEDLSFYIQTFDDQGYELLYEK